MLNISEQLAKDLDNLQNGHSWIGYNALEILEGVNASNAIIKSYEGGNSLWQIVNHISYWRGLVARRISERKLVQAEKEGFDMPAMASEENWKATIERFTGSWKELREAILSLTEEELFAQRGEGQTLYYNINGCLQHDAFHLGQVILLKRMAGLQT